MMCNQATNSDDPYLEQLRTAFEAISTNWPATNARRAELIGKRALRTLTADEANEFDKLQAYCSARQDLIAPLPFTELEDRLVDIMERKLKESEAYRIAVERHFYKHFDELGWDRGGISIDMIRVFDEFKKARAELEAIMLHLNCKDNPPKSLASYVLGYKQGCEEIRRRWTRYNDGAPLTAELLQKNGFVLNEVLQIWQRKLLNGRSVEFAITPKDSGILFADNRPGYPVSVVRIFEGMPTVGQFYRLIELQ